MNVVSVNGGKVHTMMTGMEEHPYPLCRGGGMNQRVTKFRTTDAPLSCKTCLTYAERRAAKIAAEAQAEREAEAEAAQHQTAYEALFYAEDGNAIAEGICEHCKDSADNNADDTSTEEGFEYQSERWYEVAVNTYASAHDDHTTEENHAAYFRATDVEALTEGPKNAYDAAYTECRALNWTEADAHEYAMRVARAQEDADAVRAQAAEAAQPTKADRYTEAFDKGRALGMDHAEAADYANEVLRTTKGENVTTYTHTTTHPVTGMTATFSSDQPAKWAAWDGGELVGFSNVEHKHAALATLPKGRKLVVTAIVPISSDDLGASAKITGGAPEKPEATTAKDAEMPTRKKAAAATPPAPPQASETEDAIQRVRDLTAQVLAIVEAGEGADLDRAKELRDQAEAIIRDLPTEFRTKLRESLEAAKRGEVPGLTVDADKPAKKTASRAVAKKAAAAPATSKETQDYRTAIPDAEKVIADIASALAAGTKTEIDNSNTTRAVAEKILVARLHLTDKDGHPDFHGKSQAAKNITTDVITGAGTGIERNEESEDALDRLLKSVQNLRSDVLVKYVRNITAEDAHKFFPLAFKADPKAEPAAAIQSFYKIPEKSTFEVQAEKRRLERQQRAALGAGDEKKAKELGEAIKTVGKPEGGEGEAAAAPTTAAEKRTAKHLGAIEAASEKLSGLEADLAKISAEEGADLAEKLEAFIGKASALAAMLKGAGR